jgi:hypothetical protein
MFTIRLSIFPCIKGHETMSRGKRVRYVLEEGAAFTLHGEGLTVQAVTRKSGVPITVEIEGMSRKRLLQFQEAIEEELARREASWRRQEELLLRQSPEEAPGPDATEARPAA